MFFAPPGSKSGYMKKKETSMLKTNVEKQHVFVLLVCLENSFETQCLKTHCKNNMCFKTKFSNVFQNVFKIVKKKQIQLVSSQSEENPFGKQGF